MPWSFTRRSWAEARRRCFIEQVGLLCDAAPRLPFAVAVLLWALDR